VKALGTVVGIIIFLLIVLASIAVILAYYGAFEGMGAQLSQAQINIYNHQNENLEVTATAYYKFVSHSDCGVGRGAYHGQALGIYKYDLLYITVTITNVGKVPSTITYIVISNPSGVQLFIMYVGQTLAPSQSIDITIYPQQLYYPYWPNWESAPIAQYIPYQITIDQCHNQQTQYYQVPVIVETQYGNMFYNNLNYEL
jgi:hypothetical protein